MKYLAFVVAFLSGCFGVDKYSVSANHITDSGYKLDTRDVSVTDEFIAGLDDRLIGIDKCYYETSQESIDKDNLIIKLVEQTYFSKCNPWEELLDDDAPMEGCKAKPELDRCGDAPCKWRTLTQDRWHVIVPMRSKETPPEQLNLWMITAAQKNDIYTWPYYKISRCIGGCK